jgi:hypothetical protein
MSVKKTRDYNPMSEDGYDSKIPLHNDAAFQHGIQFNAKVKKKKNKFRKISFCFWFSLLAHWKYQNQQVELKSLLLCVVFA